MTIIFRRVYSFDDDAITVRVRRSGDRIVAVLDFPSFQVQNGKIVKADSIPFLPVDEALAKAARILPYTPFPEVVIKLDDDVEWQSEWGNLTSGQ